MRQVTVKAPAGNGQEILDIIQNHQAHNQFVFRARDQEREWDIVDFSLPNREIGPFLKAVDDLVDVQITIDPHSVIPMSPPASKVTEQIKQVQARSPTEVWLNSLQSVGAWKGFLGYTVAAAIVAWIGLFSNTLFLLVAAMLIAPFAGPAMNVAISTAVGDRQLLQRNLLRYFVALAVMILTTYLLSLALPLSDVTRSMDDVGEISAIAVLLPLVTGAAGALNLIQAENSSLVSGTAVGLLVAAALAPPAALIGMSASLSRWDMTTNGAFLLLLQLVGINLGGSLVFRLYGMNAEGARYKRGRPAIFYTSIAVSLAGLGALLFWQFSSSPAMQRSTRAQEALGPVKTAITNYDPVWLVEAEVRFPRPSIPGADTLLVVTYVEQKPEYSLSDDEIRREVTKAVQEQLLRGGYQVTPLVSVTVLDPPGELNAGGN